MIIIMYKYMNICINILEWICIATMLLTSIWGTPDFGPQTAPTLYGQVVRVIRVIRVISVIRVVKVIRAMGVIRAIRVMRVMKGDEG